ncbi:MAG: bifunctional phosphoribosylaminoimidazolecarboxamide formyltransferase/IMP cyclohydrolase [Elusimicrobia bacterium]|nr:bifunctional phosphoribosylaminoimidazolecarboxamide formyltransferase/IMP cyclohydrolase [Candidatus Obscuribacterium magneticum]
MITRALLSVTDKTGVVDFAHRLHELGAEIVSTGGTAATLRQAEINVKEVSDITGFPEILDGRVKTLHPIVFGGLLGLPDKPEHKSAMQTHGIVPFDLIAVNLYPFEKVIEGRSLDDKEMVEYIDIGGVALLRAAAKNYRNVIPLCDPKDYGLVLEELQSPLGLSDELRHKLAIKAFAHTAHYDSVISSHLRSRWGKTDKFSEEMTIGLRKIRDLRYGENPHQQAAIYKESGAPSWGVVSANILQGKEISFNNYLDCEAAWQLALSFTDPVCAIVKHNNPCGVATAKNPAEAYRWALMCDPVSAFGGIVGFNRAVDREAAEELKKLFLECVIAPSYHPEALEILKSKKNLRVLEQPTPLAAPYDLDVRRISGGYLVQDFDRPPVLDLKVATKRSPNEPEKGSLDFAWRVCKYVKSNAIVLARGRQTVGIGAGQMSRIDSLRIAAQKMKQAKLDVGESLVMASDAFFPFRDTVDEAAKTGVTAIIQPGGSVRDEESIKAADENNIAMVFTGVRHFRH